MKETVPFLVFSVCGASTILINAIKHRKWPRIEQNQKRHIILFAYYQIQNRSRSRKKNTFYTHNFIAHIVFMVGQFALYVGSSHKPSSQLDKNVCKICFCAPHKSKISFDLILFSILHVVFLASHFSIDTNIWSEFTWNDNKNWLVGWSSTKQNVDIHKFFYFSSCSFIMSTL